MKRKELAAKMAGKPSNQADGLITAASIMLSRGQSCIAADILRAGFALFGRKLDEHTSIAEAFSLITG